jgi:hypothetical protein
MIMLSAARAFHHDFSTLPFGWVIGHHPAGPAHPGDLSEKDRSANSATREALLLTR